MIQKYLFYPLIDFIYQLLNRYEIVLPSFGDRHAMLFIDYSNSTDE